jgi:AraC family transcriptional regulator of adaptative response/methylated-DNA-[protein]-cysteine methyltransferase
MHELPTRAVMERAFSERDQGYDGLFFAAVSTTGIFCRPSCPARKPKTEHISFYATAAEALFSGYRPCLRCRPLNSGGDPEWMRDLVDRVQSEPSARLREQDLRNLGLDPATVRRRFLARYGLTFHAFQRSRRLAAAFESIKAGGSIDDAVFDHGFDSHSGFRDAFSRLFGEAPGKAATGDFARIAWMDSPLGPLVAGATDRGVCLLEFSDRRMLETQGKVLRNRLGLAAAPGRNAHLDQLQLELNEYFAGARKEFGVALHEPGSAFQESVWASLRTIPYGKTWSYAELAVAIGNPAAVRAVAKANGANRIAIVVPCHRVVNASGELGGYGGGVWRKRRLLELEADSGVH